MFNKLRQITDRREDKEKEFFYHLLLNNCECFVYEWKYSEKWSLQSEFVVRTCLYALLNGSVISCRHKIEKYVTIYREKIPVIVILYGVNIVLLTYENWEKIGPYVNKIEDEIARRLDNAMGIFFLFEGSASFSE